jgi:nitrite reductase/ring-hydroxylating ferredoxin subunit
MAWKRTGVASAELREGLLHGTTAGTRPVVLVRLGGEVHAVDGTCPHLGGDLAEGTVEQGKITCPLHGATFDLLTGTVRADPFGVAPPEGAVGPLPTFAVRIADGTIEVDVPDA